jgi:hypothetical protein
MRGRRGRGEDAVDWKGVVDFALRMGPTMAMKKSKKKSAKRVVKKKVKAVKKKVPKAVAPKKSAKQSAKLGAKKLVKKIVKQGAKKSAGFAAKKNAVKAAKKKAPDKQKFVERKIRGKADEVEVGAFERRGIGARSGGQSGDTQGLAGAPESDSESVEELLEEGQAFEAEVVAGIENVPDADQGEVRTHEVPEDDIPEEYLGSDNQK